MKVAGVVVLYNPSDDVFDNIDTYLYCLDKLYIVDNSEKNNINSKILKNKKIEYIPNGENKGIAYALNVAARRALDSKFDWLLTMDQDSKFKGNDFDKMIQYLKDYANNTFVSESLNFDFNKVAVVSPTHITKINENVEIKGILFPLLVMTSGNLINLKVYEEVNGFNDDFFIDCVDFDYCLNIRKHGYEVIQFTSIHLIHNLGDIQQKKFLGKTSIVTNHNYIRRYYITRNRHYLFDLYKDDFFNYCSLELSLNRKELFKIILFEKDKFRKIRSIYRGYRDYKKSIVGRYNYKN